MAKQSKLKNAGKSTKKSGKQKKSNKNKKGNQIVLKQKFVMPQPVHSEKKEGGILTYLKEFFNKAIASWFI